MTKVFDRIFRNRLSVLLSVYLLVSCSGDDSPSQQSSGDTTAPVISLIGDSPLTLLLGTPYVEAGASASDNLDGDISANIVISGSVDINTLGTYTITYSVSDAANNESSITRTVFIVDTYTKTCESESAPYRFTTFSSYDTRALKAITIIPNPLGPDRVAGIDASGLALLQPDGDLVLQELDSVSLSGLNQITSARIFNEQYQQVIVADSNGIKLYSASSTLTWRADAATGAVIDFAVVDFQGDGIDELLVLTASGVQKLADDGNGGLSMNTLSMVLPASPTALVADFIDNDAYLDIVVISASEGAVFYGAANDNYASKVALPTLANYRALALFDIDHANDLDLLISTDSEVKLLSGGTRTHSVSATLSLANIDHFRKIVSPQDSYVDVFAIGNIGTDQWDMVRLANDVGSLSIAQPLATPINAMTVFDAFSAEMSCDDQAEMVFVAGDINGTAKFIGIYRGENGDFAAPTMVDVPAGITEDVVAGDFNGDGLDDIVAAHRDANDTRLYLNLGGGKLAAGVSLHAANSPMDVLVARINNDTYFDIIIAEEGDAAITILLGDGSAGFTASTLDLSAVGSARAIALGDFDGDQIDDLFAADVNNSGHLFKGDGAGGFSYLTSVSNFAASGFGQSLALADLNGDTHLDAIIGGTVMNSAGYLYLLPGNGDGSFATPVQLLTHRVTKVYPINANGDSAIDLVVDAGDFSPGVRIYSNDNDGMGSLTVQTALSGLSTNNDGFPSLVGLIDLNADGLDDPVVATSDSGARSHGVFLNQGDLSVDPVYFWGGRNNGSAFGQLDDKPGFDFVTVTFAKTMLVFRQR